MPERKFKVMRLVVQENSHPEIRKTYFLVPKWGVDLYTGSTYTRVNTVVSFLLYKIYVLHSLKFSNLKL